MNNQIFDDTDGCDVILFGAALCLIIVLLGYGMIMFLVERVLG